jgi:hypothetical protein
MENEIKPEENKTNAELLEEVKKLRQSVEDDNKKKQQNTGYNSLITIGAILIAVAFFLWQCTGLFE